MTVLLRIFFFIARCSCVRACFAPCHEKTSHLFIVLVLDAGDVIWYWSGIYILSNLYVPGSCGSPIFGLRCWCSRNRLVRHSLWWMAHFRIVLFFHPGRGRGGGFSISGSFGRGDGVLKFFVCLRMSCVLCACGWFFVLVQNSVQQ